MILIYRVSAKKVRFSLRAYCFTIMKSFLTPNGSSEKLLFSTFQKSPRMLRLDLSLWSQSIKRKATLRNNFTEMDWPDCLPREVIDARIGQLAHGFFNLWMAEAKDLCTTKTHNSPRVDCQAQSSTLLFLRSQLPSSETAATVSTEGVRS